MFSKMLRTSPSNKMDVIECRLQRKAAVKAHRWAGEGRPAFSGLDALTWRPEECTLLSCSEGYIGAGTRSGKECLKYLKSELSLLTAGLPRKVGAVSDKRNQSLYTVTGSIHPGRVLFFSFLLFLSFSSSLLSFSFLSFEHLLGISLREAMQLLTVCLVQMYYS